jgi:hypothetical protein
MDGSEAVRLEKLYHTLYRRGRGPTRCPTYPQVQEIKEALDCAGLKVVDK